MLSLTCWYWMEACLSTLGVAAQLTFSPLLGLQSTGWRPARQCLDFPSITLLTWQFALILPPSVECQSGIPPQRQRWTNLWQLKSVCKFCRSLQVESVLALPWFDWVYFHFRCIDAAVEKLKFKSQYLLNDKLLHLVDDIFWHLGFKRRTRWKGKETDYWLLWLLQWLWLF